MDDFVLFIDAKLLYSLGSRNQPHSVKGGDGVTEVGETGSRLGLTEVEPVWHPQDSTDLLRRGEADPLLVLNKTAQHSSVLEMLLL